MSKFIMFHKPKGCVTARRDAVRPTVMDYFPEEWRDLLHPVGRLDIDTEGLLILTDDGHLDNRLMQPKRHVEKCYFFMAVGDVGEEGARRFREGVELYQQGVNSCPAVYEELRRTTIADVKDWLPEFRRSRYLKNPGGAVTVGRLTITEGKKHQVKLMLKSVGCTIFYLKRERVGGLTLDESLAPGQWRELTEAELAALCDETL
ncbi:MAG: pseudouridine synthase [Clostridia bacterium]|nr:pseudouridine synthase [Clostridia bacterium]